MSTTFLNFMENYRTTGTESQNILSWGKFNGCFNIPKSEYSNFLNKYTDEILGGSDLCIAEKQKDLTHNNIVVDFDIKIIASKNKRLYTKSQIKKTIKIYIDTLEELNIDIEKIEINAFEKSEPSIKNDEIKDGFHLYISGLKFTKEMRQKIYDTVNEKLTKKKIFEDHNISEINDKSVISTNGWLLYGSKKPAATDQKYELTLIYSGKESDYIDNNLTTAEKIKKFSFSNNDEVFDKTESDTESDTDSDTDSETDSDTDRETEEIKELNKKISKLETDDEIIEYLVDCLSEDRAKNYDDWIKVAILLKSLDIDYKIFDKFSKKSMKNYNEAGNKKIWKQIKDNNSENKMTVATLYYWAKQDNEKEFNKIIKMCKPLTEKQIKYNQKQQEKENKYNQKQQEKEAKQKEAETELNEWYTEQKKEIEKTYFKLIDPTAIAMISDEGLKYKTVNEARTIMANINFKTHNGKKSIKFFDKWLEDEHMLTYDKVVFDPTPGFNKSKIYNMYNGFELDIIAEKITKPIKIIDKLVDSIFGENSNYFYSWLNHIITKPHIKTNHAIVLYSRQHGVGKNSIIELIRVILGDKYCSKFKTIDDLLKQFNSHHANKFFIFGDEIKPRASDLAADLKNAITETQKNVEKKGIDPEVIKDCANYLFTTNDEIAFKIEEDDRRFFCAEIEECKLTKNDFEEFRKVLDNKKEMAKMFSFIKNYENPIKIVGERPPMTPYKSRLMAFSLHSVSSFLYKKIDSYCADEDEEKIREIKSLTLYEMVVKYAKESRLHAGFSPKYFGSVMKKLIDVSEGKIYKKHTISGSVYCFPNKKEVLTVLKKYSKDIYIALGCDELEGITVD